MEAGIQSDSAHANPLAPGAGLEPATCGLGNRYDYPLRYPGIK